MTDCLMVGICGVFTTFSTFSLETVKLMEAGAWATAVIYVCSSTLLGILAVFSPSICCAEKSNNIQ